MTRETFTNVTKISYEGQRSKNPLAFKYYNATEKIAGKIIQTTDEFMFGPH